MSSESIERRRPPNWITRWKDPGIIIIVLGLCITTGKQIARMDYMDNNATKSAEVIAQLTNTVSQLANQVALQSQMSQSVPDVTKAVTELRTRMDVNDKTASEFRGDLKGWMVRVETKIDQRPSRERQ